MHHRSVVFLLLVAGVLVVGFLPAEDPAPKPDKNPGPRATELKFRQDVTSANKRAPFDSFDREFPPPEGVKAFRLSQDYPSLYDLDEDFPWAKIDFRTNSIEYLRAVLNYCIEGNVGVDFQGQDNPVRKWYHAPWMDNDSAEKKAGLRQGREYHHGLTRERRSLARELHPLQVTDKIQNWAVSLYNARGGYTIGRVWLTPDGFPDPSNATFPDHTVTFKLLFTAGALAEVPYLDKSLEWTANINPPAATQPFNRVDQKLRLLQVDVAIKDPRVAATTGWIFGTFIYDASAPGREWYERLVPVGLSWSDDLHARADNEKRGAYLNRQLRGSVINHALLEPPVGTAWGNRAFVRHHGLGGRLNGPVDNPTSSCISCHGRAGTYATSLPVNDLSGYPTPFLAGSGNAVGTLSAQVADFQEFFRPIRGGSHLERAPTPDRGPLVFVTTDYSLQLSQGIRNYYQALRTAPRLTAIAAHVGGEENVRRIRALPPLPNITRGAGD